VSRVRLACFSSCLAASLAAAQTPAPSTSGVRSDHSADELQAALRAFEAFDSASARRQLTSLLQHGPSARIAATAHVYLGLIALNDLDQAGAEREFQAALRADVLVELPHNQSPKAELLFSRARQEMLTQTPAPNEPSAAAVAPSPASPPEAGPAAVPAVKEPWTEPAASAPPRTPSRAPAYVVAAAALASLGVGIIYGALQQSALSAGKAAPKGADAQADASTWSTDGTVADVCFGVAALAAGTSVWLFIAESPSSDGRTTASSAQTAVGFGGRF